MVSLVALALAAGAGVPSYPVWPSADNHQLDKPGSPGVVRKGATLEFTGQVPFSAHVPSGDRAGHRVSFGAAPPEEEPAPSTWEHYAPDGVTFHSPERGTIPFTPAEFENKAKLGYFILSFLLDFLILAVFFFVVTLLLRFKGVVLPALGPLRLLGRCLIPACLYSAAVAYFVAMRVTDRDLIERLAVGVFVLVLGMNAILFVLAAKPETPAQPFDV